MVDLLVSVQLLLHKYYPVYCNLTLSVIARDRAYALKPRLMNITTTEHTVECIIGLLVGLCLCARTGIPQYQRDKVCPPSIQYSFKGGIKKNILNKNINNAVWLRYATL